MSLDDVQDHLFELTAARVAFARFVEEKPHRAPLGTVYGLFLDLEPDLAVPACGPGGDLGGWEMVWDTDEHHLCVDLTGTSDGGFVWFYRDKRSELTAHGEDATSLPKLREVLTLFRSTPCWWSMRTPRARL